MIRKTSTTVTINTGEQRRAENKLLVNSLSSSETERVRKAVGSGTKFGKSVRKKILGIFGRGPRANSPTANGLLVNAWSEEARKKAVEARKSKARIKGTVRSVKHKTAMQYPDMAAKGLFMKKDDDQNRQFRKGLAQVTRQKRRSGES
jgi:hypothetical protein